MQQVAAGVPGQNSVHAAPNAKRPVNVSAALVTWLRTAQEQTSMEFNKNKSSAVTRSVTHPSTVTGAAGHHGVCAVLNVGLEHKPEQDPVTIHHHDMVANNAPVARKIHKLANRSHAESGLMTVNLTLMGYAIGRWMTVIPQVLPGSETQEERLPPVPGHPQIIHLDQATIYTLKPVVLPEETKHSLSAVPSLQLPVVA